MRYLFDGSLPLGHGILGIPVKVNSDFNRKPNGVPVKANPDLAARPYDEPLRSPDRLRRITVKWIVPAVLILLLTPICLAADRDEPLKPAQSTDELRQQLEKILKERIPTEFRWRLLIKTDPSG